MKFVKAPRTWADSMARPKQLKMGLRKFGIDAANWIQLAQWRGL
jgi:hypothetical protein